MSFTHLHVHSHYSLLDGLAKPEQLLEKTKKQGLKSLAITDHGVMYGCIDFYQKAKEFGIKPIIGVETYVAQNGLESKRPNVDIKPYHLILLARNEVGYKNLMYLVTEAHLKGFYYKPRVDFALLKNHHEGIIALSACLQGEIPQQILNGNLKKAESLARQYNDLLGQGNFYLELQDHPNIQEQGLINEELIKFSKKLSIPLVATNDTHYLEKEDDKIQDILICIQTQKKVDDKDRLSMIGNDFSLRDPADMENAFKDIPEALENTEAITKLCNVEIELGKIKLPKFEIPKKYSYLKYLIKSCLTGLQRRYSDLEFQLAEINPDDTIDPNKNGNNQKEKLLKRLNYELGVIKKTGFASYLLIVADFVNWAKNNKIVTGPGRGSAAGSFVCYLLNITEIDPIKYDLLFERFLNPERISMPDIDMDFADDRRDEVLGYVRKKYGDEKVAQIITFGTMAARAAIRDCGRALDYPYDYCDKVAKLIPMFSSLEDALENVTELQTLYNTDPQAKKLIDYSKKLEGVARHASTHACGTIIAPQNIVNYTPQQYGTRDDKSIITQYEMHAVEALGLLKMDFLGLKNLTIIQNAIKIIEKTKNVEIDIAKIPLDDQSTFQLLQKGQTTGVFQLESSGMKRYLKQLKPSELENIIAMVALYRPGPIEWIPDYIAGKTGEKEPTYIHPKLEPILKKTYGVAIYQEQIMQTAQSLAGFSLGEADILRKAVGKKIKELLVKQKVKFIRGCIDNKISRKIAEQVFAFIEPFAGYGFNRSHAACYALIAYQTAYLKAHYPCEFMAALLTSDQENMDRIAIEISESEQLGIKVLPPDVNESFADFTAVIKKDSESIRFGLRAIKNVGENIVNKIIEERKKAGKYKSLEDLAKRVVTKDFNKKSLEALAKSGALDSIGERKQILENTERILSFSKAEQKAKLQGQKDLFSNLMPNIQKEAALKIRLENVEPATKKERLAWERELLGLYVSDHPLSEYRNYLTAHTVLCHKLQKNCRPNQIVVIGGIISEIKKIITRSGEPMLFAKMEDLTSTVEILVFPSILKENPNLWQTDKILLVKGKISDKDGEVKILAQKVKELETDKVKEWEKQGSKVKTYSPLKITIIQGANQNLFQELKNILIKSKGKQSVILKIPDSSNNFKEMKTSLSVDYNANLKESLMALIDKGKISI
jgi:DNA polymerase-3 subunit alpha